MSDDRTKALELASRLVDPHIEAAHNVDVTALARALIAAEERCERLERALRTIDADPFISYDAHYREPGMSDANRQWQIGFTDGVRRCVDVVRPALATKGPNNGK